MSGLALKPTDSLYDVLREPVRLGLNLSWMLVSCWFLVHNPKIISRFAVISVIFALLTGIYLTLVVFGIAPASQDVTAYMRIYFLRQIISFNGTLVPRMGGLFIEAPPFGLYMFSMLTVLVILLKHSIHSRWSVLGVWVAALGMLLSMADQVLIGSFAWAIVSIPSLKGRSSKLIWVLAVIASVIIGGFEIRTIILKEQSAGGKIATDINGSSIGERDFHLRYGMSLLQAMPAATILGIGPGRYGEYAAETGNYPDTVNMQITEPEILVEWGVLGLLFWIILLYFIAIQAWRNYGFPGIGLVLGLLIADSFQANWKYEAVFLAIAVLCTPRSTNLEERAERKDLPPIAGLRIVNGAEA